MSSLICAQLLYFYYQILHVIDNFGYISTPQDPISLMATIAYERVDRMGPTELVRLQDLHDLQIRNLYYVIMQCQIFEDLKVNQSPSIRIIPSPRVPGPNHM